MAEPISVQVEKVNDTERNIKVSVGELEVGQALDKALNAVRKKARIKGFRKGKVPLEMVKKLYSDEIKSEAIHHLLDLSYPQALDQCELKIVSRPTISDLEFNQGKPFTYVAKVEIMPEVNLTKYKGLKIEVSEEKVTDEKIDQQLEMIRESQAQMTPIDPPRPLEKGDFAIVDFKGTLDGELFEGGSGEGMTIELGSGRAVQGFEENLLGALPNEEREFEVVFPDNQGELSGKTIHFQVKIKEAKFKVLPELNDELAKDVGNFSTLKELKENIANELQRACDEGLKKDQNQKLFEALVKENPLSIPKAMVEQELNRMIEEAKNSMALRGHPLEKEDVFLEKLREDFRKEALERVHCGFLLEAISKAEEFDVGDQDMEQYLQTLASRSKNSPEEIRELYKKHNAIEDLKLKVLEEKTLEFLRQNAKIIKKIRNSSSKSGTP